MRTAISPRTTLMPIVMIQSDVNRAPPKNHPTGIAMTPVKTSSTTAIQDPTVAATTHIGTVRGGADGAVRANQGLGGRLGG